MATFTAPEDRRLPDFLGMSQKEIERYDLMSWIRSFATPHMGAAPEEPAPSLVTEVDAEIHRRLGGAERTGDPGGGRYVRVPRDILHAQHRTMTTSPGSKGGYAVGVQTSFIEGFYASNVALELGARTIDAYEGQVAFASVKSGPSVAWLRTDGTATASTPEFGLVSSSPKTAVTIEVASESYLKQVGTEGQGFLLNDIGAALGAAAGIAGISGTGGEQPLGVLNTPGVGSVAGGSFDHAKSCDMIEDVHSANIKNRAATGFAGSPDVECLLRKRERSSGSGSFIWDADAIGGRRALASNAVAAASLIYGSWNELVFVNYGGLRIDVNRYYGFNSYAAAIRATWDVDVVIRNLAAFSVAKSIT